MKNILPIIVLLIGVNMVRFGATDFNIINGLGCILVGVVCGYFDTRNGS